MRLIGRAFGVVLGILGILSTYTAYSFIVTYRHNLVESKNLKRFAPARVNFTSASKLIFNNPKTKNLSNTQDFSAVQEQLVSITKWNASLPSSMTRPDWCLVRNSGEGRFV